MVNDFCHDLTKKYNNIQNIDVKIEDINGPFKTGIDKRCHLKVRGKDHLAIDIDDIDEDITYAIESAFHHLKKILERYQYNKYRKLDSRDLNNCYLIKA
jgi:ribosome-associated translation inhibitor RaiA